MPERIRSPRGRIRQRNFSKQLAEAARAGGFGHFPKKEITAMIVVIQQSIAGNADDRYGLAEFSFRPREVVDLDDTLAAAWIEAGIAVAQEDFAAAIPITPGNTPPPDPPTPPPGIVGDPTETNVVQWPVGLADTDIAFTTAPATVVVDSTFLIDAEYMTVVDVSNIDNPGVTRGAHESIIAEHAAGAVISIWPPASVRSIDSAPVSRAHKKNSGRTGR
jgi:hypothetical protein